MINEIKKALKGAGEMISNNVKLLNERKKLIVQVNESNNRVVEIGNEKQMKFEIKKVSLRKYIRVTRSIGDFILK